MQIRGIKKYKPAAKRNKEIFDLDVAEIIPSTMDENLGTSTAIHTGSEKRLNDKHISPI